LNESFKNKFPNIHKFVKESLINTVSFLKSPFLYLLNLAKMAQDYILDKLEAIPGLGKFVKKFRDKKGEDDSIQKRAKVTFNRPTKTKEQQLMWFQYRMSQDAYNLLGNDPKKFENLKKKGLIQDVSRFWEQEYWEATPSGLQSLENYKSKIKKSDVSFNPSKLKNIVDSGNYQNRDYTLYKSGQLYINDKLVSEEIKTNYLSEQIGVLNKRIKSGAYGSEIVERDENRKALFEYYLQ
jgi:hypothetical protein